MPNIKKFRVLPYLPENLKPLLRIAQNLLWVWNFEAIELFRRLGVDMWRELSHNPMALLGSLPQEMMNEAAESESFLAHMNRVEEELDWQLTKKTWFQENSSIEGEMNVAYLSAEFGIHECLPIYSGGLGVLAGDHLKSASEIGIPLTGVGLLYKLGYFHQYLNVDGWQQEKFPATDFYNIPVQLVKDENNETLFISVEYPGRNVYAQIWEVQIGRIQLYLLDTDIDKNSGEDRWITYQLYGGDNEMRIKQEMLLGIGGVRALKEMKKNITVFHMNEGHSAFLSIERIRLSMKEKGLSYNEALANVCVNNVFTTHTPVPAGNDRFDPELVGKYLSFYINDMGIKKEDFLALGREVVTDKEETFCMTVLAIKTAAFCNGVSALHGTVSRNMWKALWPSLPVHNIPITHITNGIQTLSWTSDEMMRVLNRYLGPRWIDNPVDKDIWLNVDSIPDSELWRCRERMKERLVGFSRNKLKKQLKARGMPKYEVEMADAVLDSEALTIGFARRFATYKRATLIFKNMERLEKIISNKDRPVQFIFSGKAHPKDNMGKELIKELIKLARDEKFRNKIVFLEDYDINIARYLVQGADVWLNTPTRPKEASGTSGMKVVPNGGLNISVLDGWWAEAYNGSNGWTIGHGEEYDEWEHQNYIESESLYNILENEVIPMFYDRGADGIPREWVARIKESMKTICPIFNTNRMVRDYTEKFYLNAHNNCQQYRNDNYKVAREFSGWQEKISGKWKEVKIKEIYIKDDAEIVVGKRINVEAVVNLGTISPEEVQVELYFGNLNSEGDIQEGASISMDKVNGLTEGDILYEGQVLCLKSGQFGFTVRVIPYHKDMARKYKPGLVTWA
ncbi:MAG: alpha-glucan family phosphorylase [Spirochaetes bacterium]|nr:alpha-glucan family phosphorylase [Spirochaetota bacterium]